MFLKAHTLIRQVHLKSVLLATTDIFLLKHCVKSVQIHSFSGPYLNVFHAVKDLNFNQLSKFQPIDDIYKP